MKKKIYVILYYISFAVTVFFLGFACYKSLISLSTGNGGFGEIIMDLARNILFIINLLLVIVFTLFLIKNKKIDVKSIIFPIVYICFLIAIVVLCFLFNNKVVLQNIQFEYYAYFINIGFLFLNIYSLLSLQYCKK